MRTILVGLILALAMLVPIVAQAAPGGQIWVHDSTYIHSTAAEKYISIIPTLPLGRYAQSGWSIALLDSSGADTLTARVQFWAPNTSDNVRGRQFYLDTKHAPRFPGRLDSLQLHFSAGHEGMRILFAYVNGTAAFPEWGLEALQMGNEPLDIAGVTEATFESALDAIVAAYEVGDAFFYVKAGSLGIVSSITAIDEAKTSLLPPTGFDQNFYTVTTTKVDTLPGATVKKHIPIRAFSVCAEDTVWLQWTDANGDTAFINTMIRPFIVYDFGPVDLYSIEIGKHTANANVSIWKYGEGVERTVP